MVRVPDVLVVCVLFAFPFLASVPLFSVRSDAKLVGSLWKLCGRFTEPIMFRDGGSFRAT